MPLIACVIAFVPQISCREMIALHSANALDLVAVGNDATFKVDQVLGGVNIQLSSSYSSSSSSTSSSHYETFIDCSGQPHLNIDDFPFRGLVQSGCLSQAFLKFRSVDAAQAARNKSENIVVEKQDGYYLKVPGVAINDQFQVIDQSGNANERIFMMAVPFIGGFNPDYSGLDFCQEASLRIVNSLTVH